MPGKLLLISPMYLFAVITKPLLLEPVIGQMTIDVNNWSHTIASFSYAGNFGPTTWLWLFLGNNISITNNIEIATYYAYITSSSGIFHHAVVGCTTDLFIGIG
jgi:hypothetical protein